MEVRNVSFSYGDKEIIRDLSFAHTSATLRSAVNQVRSLSS